MRIFNIGIREVLLLLVIMLILFGPKQMQENARKFAQTIRRIVRSDTWRTFLGMYDDVNAIKDEVIRESGIREVRDSLRGVNRELINIDKDLRGNGLDQGPVTANTAAAPEQQASEQQAPETENDHESESDRL